MAFENLWRIAELEKTMSTKSLNRLRANVAGLGLVASISVAAVPAHAAEDVTLSVPVKAQQQSLWCWAAVSQAVLAYHGQTTVQQCDLVEWALAPSGGYQTDCCANPSACNFSETGQAATGILANWAIPGDVLLSQSSQPRAATFAEVKREIGQNSPILRAVKWTSGGAHVTVVRGYDDRNGQQLVHIMDPGGGGSYYTTTYANALSNSAGWWSNTRLTETFNQNQSSGGIRYREANKERIYSFHQKFLTLAVNYWNGAAWNWANQGTPPGESWLKGNPAIINYEVDDAYGTPAAFQHAFQVGASGKLWANHYNGNQWAWLDLGKPSADSLGGYIASVVHKEAPTPGYYVQPRKYVFGVGSTSGKMFLNYWNGTQYQWLDQGKPSGVNLSSGSEPGVVSFRNQDKQSVYAFTQSTGRLYVNFSTGGAWQWADQGKPSSTTVAGSPKVVSYKEGFVPLIYAYVRGGNGNLFVNYWNGSTWQWADLGAPPSTAMSGDAGVVNYRENGLQKTHVFVRGSNGRLYDKAWNGSSWSWIDRGFPAAGVTVASGPINAISYREGDVFKVYAFVSGSNGRHYVNYWTGTAWAWADQGAF